MSRFEQSFVNRPAAQEPTDPSESHVRGVVSRRAEDIEESTEVIPAGSVNFRALEQEVIDCTEELSRQLAGQMETLEDLGLLVDKGGDSVRSQTTNKLSRLPQVHQRLVDLFISEVEPLEKKAEQAEAKGAQSFFVVPSPELLKMIKEAKSLLIGEQEEALVDFHQLEKEIITHVDRLEEEMNWLKLLVQRIHDHGGFVRPETMRKMSQLEQIHQSIVRLYIRDVEGWEVEAKQAKAEGAKSFLVGKSSELHKIIEEAQELLMEDVQHIDDDELMIEDSNEDPRPITDAEILDVSKEKDLKVQEELLQKEVRFIRDQMIQAHGKYIKMREVMGSGSVYTQTAWEAADEVWTSLRDALRETKQKLVDVRRQLSIEGPGETFESEERQQEAA